MCVSMYVGVSIYAYIYVRVCARARAHVWTDIHAYIFARVCVSVCVL